MPQESQPAVANPPIPEEEALRLLRWQLRLLPLMTRTLLGVAVFFFLVSLGQILYLHWRIESGTGVDLSGPLSQLQPDASVETGERRESTALGINALLEANAMQRRYHQANVVLMARVWTSYLGFVTGMALAIVGAAFILGRVQGTDTKVKTEVGALRAEIATAAPGIMMVFLGVTLMIATLFVKYEISVQDASVYLNRVGVTASESEKTPPPFPDIDPKDQVQAPDQRAESTDEQ